MFDNKYHLACKYNGKACKNCGSTVRWLTSRTCCHCKSNQRGNVDADATAKRRAIEDHQNRDIED